MDFITAVKHVLSNFANFHGRARRSEYWWWALFSVVLSLLTGWIPIIGFLISLALVVPTIAVGVRRMHDTGRSGWYILLPAVPAALMGLTNFLAPSASGQPGALFWLLGLVYVAAAILLIYWFVQRGTVGPNAWGQDPYDDPTMS